MVDYKKQGDEHLNFYYYMKSSKTYLKALVLMSLFLHDQCYYNSEDNHLFIHTII